jgi:hypothetical protein
MKHEKTFSAISKLKDIEMELHRLKNALEMANRALDAQRTWVGMTDEDCKGMGAGDKVVAMWADRTLKDKNT